MGRKPIVSLTYENERISIKNSLPFSLYKGKPLYREKTVAIKTHKRAINRPVDHTGEM